MNAAHGVTVWFIPAANMVHWRMSAIDWETGRLTDQVFLEGRARDPRDVEQAIWEAAAERERQVAETREAVEQNSLMEGCA